MRAILLGIPALLRCPRAANAGPGAPAPVKAAPPPGTFETSPSIQCTTGSEPSGTGTTANWPTYHFMNNVTKNGSGALLLEPLNDANAIAEYKGIFHIMMQEGLCLEPYM